MENAFNFKNLTSSFRNAETLNRSNVNSIKYGNSCLPRYQNVKNFSDYKELTCLSMFKSKVKSWVTDECTC